MAIYHCTVKIGSRSKGQSAIAASAYRSGSKLTDKEIGQTSDYTHKGGVVFSEISLCKNAPAEYADREVLWNAVHKIEKQKNAQLWREIEVAIPREFERERQIEVVRNFVKPLVEDGMCADWSIHDKGDGNPHAHIMLTMRPIKTNGEWGDKEKKVYALDENGNKIPVIDENTGEQKIGARGRRIWQRVTVKANDWNDKSKVEEWRALWAKSCNDFLEEEKKIDHRSFERQGKDEIPTIHEGYAARQIVASGGVSELVEYNKQVTEQNNLIRKIVAQLKEVQEKIKEVTMEGIENGKRQLSEFADFLRGYGKSEVGRNASDDRRASADDQRPTGNDQAERELAELLQGYGKKEVGRNASDDRRASADDQQPRAEDQSAGTAELFRSIEDELTASRAARRKSETTVRAGETYREKQEVERRKRDNEAERQALEASRAAAAAQRAAEEAARRAAEEQRRREEEERRRIEEERKRTEKARKSYRGYGE